MDLDERVRRLEEQMHTMATSIAVHMEGCEQRGDANAQTLLRIESKVDKALAEQERLKDSDHAVHFKLNEHLARLEGRNAGWSDLRIIGMAVVSLASVLIALLSWLFG